MVIFKTSHLTRMHQWCTNDRLTHLKRISSSFQNVQESSKNVLVATYRICHTMLWCQVNHDATVNFWYRHGQLALFTAEQIVAPAKLFEASRTPCCCEFCITCSGNLQSDFR